MSAVLLRRVGPWISGALVIVFFGLPLFVALGTTDLKGDEPIYAFAIDRILDQGDWLTPKAIPSDRIAFLEKPPLKFWIVAASMRSGLLPQDEFGYRFWDVIFGIGAFLFVLAIGYRLSGAVCGLTADLVLFAHAPLVIEHGIRSSNMEAGLLLAYCAGIYHALAWFDATRRRPQWLHALAFGAWFAFGFMVKFVAAIFLPATVFVAAMLAPRWRRRALEIWAPWAASAGLAAALILPWFAYQFRLQGENFWHIIFGEHIFERFTAYLDPAHLHPWYFYLVQMEQQFAWSGARLLVAAGLVLLVYRAIRHRSESAVLLLTWFILPVIAISAGTSKLYHYAYPFLPPLALGAGLVVPTAMRAAHRHSDAIGALVERWWPAWLTVRNPRVRLVLAIAAVVAVVLAALTPVVGGLSLRADGHMLFRNSTTTRPLIVAAVLLLMLGLFRILPQALVLVVLLVAMPFDGYRNVKAAELQQARWEGAPMRTLRNCLLRLQHDGAPSGVYVHTTNVNQWRYAYYLREPGWNESEVSNDKKLAARLFTPRMQRPVFLDRTDYDRLRRELDAAGNSAGVARLDTTSRVVFDDDRLLLLPGPYAACADVKGAAVVGAG